ncbi:MAG: GTP 3',8-cyclase MoaA [Planctomycetota bacterium]|nr:MAG: GTP 3',8-cyclase MoaA [Planctomycetota bacterium]
MPELSEQVLDQRQRPLGSLRLSVTDRCNFRCDYCMPEESYDWLPRKDLLDFEELRRVSYVFAELGVRQLRLTGGEPLLRRNLATLVRLLRDIPGIQDIAMTTNATLLANHAQSLRDAGLNRLTVSLDSLRRERFRKLTRRDDLAAVLEGLRVAKAVGFTRNKINTVLMRGINDDECFDLLDWAGEEDHELRFIEYMDVGGATGWHPERVLSRAQLLQRISKHYGSCEPAELGTAAPADRYRLPSGQIFGVISSTTEPFCKQCHRSRVTVDGMWYLCLYARQGFDLKRFLRGGASDREIKSFLRQVWGMRADHGAEERLELAERGRLADSSELRKNPHLEMHKRGG